jgi:hypothetical protein
MTSPRLWLLLFLPLLLFAGAAPAAQTWTTAWTPDSAPSIQSAADDSDTHDSKTNCYPCVRWDPGANSGNGGWEPDPEDSKPRDCPDDDADYTCKVCDGKGRPDKNKPNTTPVDAGEGCGCCKDGQPWAPDPDCPDPIEINFDFIRAGDCPCTGCELGCMLPRRDLWFSISICYKDCSWKPVPSDPINIYYNEGPCPNRCDSSINSTNDVNASNYCDVLNKLKERIIHAENAINNPPPPPSPIGYGCDKPRETFCFMDCISRHEAIHVQQLKDEWNGWKDDLSDALRDIQVDFECDTADEKDDVRSELTQKTTDARNDLRDRFFREWDKPVKGTEHEKEAYQDTLSCLQGLRAQIEQQIADNGWKPCNNP